jgi:guanylate kinase
MCAFGNNLARQMLSYTIMKFSDAHRLIILTGPSCAGKTPLLKAFSRLHSAFSKSFAPLVLYNSRAPRPGEIEGRDYHFRTRGEIERFRSDDRYLVLEVRGDLQAVDIETLAEGLEKSDMLYEGNPSVASALMQNTRLTNAARLGIFLSPLSFDEIEELADPQKHMPLQKLVAEIMRRKLLRRARRQKGELSLPEIEDIEMRATSAYAELQQAWRFEYVIACHDGEDSEHWDAFYYPIGDARRALKAFVALLRGNASQYVEKWDTSPL